MDLLQTIAPPNVMDWPRWARRAFVITAPLSVPLWIAWFSTFLAGAVLFGLAMMLVVLAAYAITPIVWPVIWLCETVSDLWRRA